MLMMDNPDGTKPAIPLTAIQDFRQVPQGASLFETKLKASFHFLGFCDDPTFGLSVLYNRGEGCPLSIF